MFPWFSLRVRVPVSLASLGLAALCGGLLFVTDARDYAASGLFRAEMAVLALGWPTRRPSMPCAGAKTPKTPAAPSPANRPLAPRR